MEFKAYRETEKRTRRLCDTKHSGQDLHSNEASENRFVEDSVMKISFPRPRFGKYFEGMRTFLR